MHQSLGDVFFQTLHVSVYAW